jgi:hypothetical protein
LKHIYHYFAPPKEKSVNTGVVPDAALVLAGSGKIEAFSQLFDDFIPIVGNDGKIF